MGGLFKPLTEAPACTYTACVVLALQDTVAKLEATTDWVFCLGT